MIIRVSYSDNDFCTAVQEACEQVLYAIVDDYPAGNEALKRFKEWFDQYNLESLRQRIVLAAIGNHIAFKGANGRFENHKESLTTFDKTMNYIDKNVKVNFVDVFIKKWENGEVCYIDIVNKQVIVQ
jgi:hypothetical protein